VRSTSKNPIVAFHQTDGLVASCGSLARAKSPSRATQPSTVIGDGTTSAASGSARPRNSPKNRLADSSSCLKMSATTVDRGCGLYCSTPSSNARQIDASLFTSLAYTSSRFCAAGSATRGMSAGPITTDGYASGIKNDLIATRAALVATDVECR
jgi:hypothetical protein